MMFMEGIIASFVKAALGYRIYTHWPHVDFKNQKQFRNIEQIYIVISSAWISWKTIRFGLGTGHGDAMSGLSFLSSIAYRVGSWWDDDTARIGRGVAVHGGEAVNLRRDKALSGIHLREKGGDEETDQTKRARERAMK